jgi:hypothetical protein
LQAIEADPLSALPYNKRAMAYMQRKENNAALRDLTKATEVDPTFISAYTTRIKLQRAMCRYVPPPHLPSAALPIHLQAARSRCRFSRLCAARLPRLTAAARLVMRRQMPYEVPRGGYRRRLSIYDSNAGLFAATDTRRRWRTSSTC